MCRWIIRWEWKWAWSSHVTTDANADLKLGAQRPVQSTKMKFLKSPSFYVLVSQIYPLRPAPSVREHGIPCRKLPLTRGYPAKFDCCYTSCHIDVFLGPKNSETLPTVAGPRSTVKTCPIPRWVTCRIWSLKVKRCGRWERWVKLYEHVSVNILMCNFVHTGKRNSLRDRD